MNDDITPDVMDDEVLPDVMDDKLPPDVMNDELLRMLWMMNFPGWNG